MISELTAADFPEVEKFLSSAFAPIQQHPLFGEVQKSLGVIPRRIGLRRDGQLAAYAQLLLRRLPLGYSWISLPRGPIFSPNITSLTQKIVLVTDLFAVLAKIAHAEKAIFIRFDWPVEIGEWQTELAKIIPLRAAHATNFPTTTLVLDLKKSEGEILAQMKPKGRYNIRLAERHGLFIRATTAPADAEIFHTLLTKTAARDGFSGHAAGYYCRFLELFGARDLATLFLAENFGQPVAGLLATFFGGVATYYYGASDHSFRQLMAPYACQWATIRAARARDCQTYDFLGIAPLTPDGAYDFQHVLAGVTDFKLKFGGQVVSYPPAAEWVLQPMLYNFFRWGRSWRSC